MDLWPYKDTKFLNEILLLHTGDFVLHYYVRFLQLN